MAFFHVVITVGRGDHTPPNVVRLDVVIQPYDNIWDEKQKTLICPVATPVLPAPTLARPFPTCPLGKVNCQILRVRSG